MRSGRLVELWLEMVRHPPERAVVERKRLISRAAQLVSDASVSAKASVPSELDVVVSGSGFLSLYFLGVHSVLTALEAARHTELKRYAGSSSGAQTPFELVLAGEDATLDIYLSHGMLADEHARGAGLLRSAANADAHWRALGDYLIDQHADALHMLDERVHVGVTLFGWTGARYAQYSHWSERGAEVAKRAFYATGTMLTRIDGHWATDGGVTNNKPLFKDRLRTQLVVQPTKCGLPWSMACRYSFADAVRAIELGQDDAIKLIEETTPVPKALAYV